MCWLDGVTFDRDSVVFVGVCSGELGLGIGFGFSCFLLFARGGRFVGLLYRSLKSVCLVS